MKAALVLFAAGCVGAVQHAQCAVDEDCAAGNACVAAVCRAGLREADGGFCPALQPHWSDIDSNLIQVGCGVRAGNCHASDGSSGLSLADDPYARLVNGASVDGGFVLVKPGDPDHSFLAIKLRLTAPDPAYGGGMPPDVPGTVCAQAQDAVRQWILAGAERN